MEKHRPKSKGYVPTNHWHHLTIGGNYTTSTQDDRDTELDETTPGRLSRNCRSHMRMECRTRMKHPLPTLHLCMGCGVGVISDTQISLDINECPKVSVINNRYHLDGHPITNGSTMKTEKEALIMKVCTHCVKKNLAQISH